MSHLYTKQPSTLRDEIGDLIAKARSSANKEKTVEIFADKVLDTIISSAEYSEDYAPVKTTIQKYIQEMGSWQVILREMLKQVEALEASRTLRERYGERWWQQKRKVLYDTFQGDPQEGLRQWLQTYAEALITWQLNICDKLAKEPFPFPPQAADFIALFQTGTQAIRDERYLDALDMLNYLIQVESVNQPQPILDQINRAILHIFSGRIFLYKSTDRESALRHFKQAGELASDDGRPHAALGDFYRVENDTHKALRLYREAIERSPNQPDGYIGMGLMADDQKRWDEADEWYERAIAAVQNEKDFDIGLRQFLVPSGNIYLYLARKFKNEDPERALRAVTYAISSGIKQDGDYPERTAYSLKGELLETLQRPTEAAEAYYEAGRRCGWQNEHQIAIDLLTKAKELNPGHTPIFWNLSDTWRMLSYTPEPPYVDKDSIEKSIAIWEYGTHIKLPDSDYFWSYTSRALINEQLARLPNAELWTLWWEAVVYLERAILLNKSDVYCWIYLGRFYRLLSTESNALHVTHRAIEYDPTDLSALDERAAILANVGKFVEAEEVIEKRQALEPNDWMDAVKAYILLRKGQLVEALELINRSIEKSPTEIWYRDLRALGYRMNNEPARAQEDYRWIWSYYDPLDRDNQSAFGSAAYSLGDIDKAIEIFSRLCDDPTQDFFSNYCGLGECYLAKGDLAAGEENLDKAIAKAINVRQLDDLLNINFADIQKLSIDWPHGAQVREILEQLEEKIKTRRTELEQRPRSPEEELQQIVTKHERDGETGSWAWIGANAGLARLYAEEGQWVEAANLYKQLLALESLLYNDMPPFPEARRGLELCAGKIEQFGEEAFKAGQTNEAIRHYEHALQLDGDISRDIQTHESITRTAGLHAKLALAMLDTEDVRAASNPLAAALNLCRQVEDPDPVKKLADLLKPMLRNGAHYWQMHDALNLLTGDQNNTEALRHDIATLNKMIAGYLEDRYGLSIKQSDILILPIILEIGDELIPEDTRTENWSLFTRLIPEMRNRIKEEMGVTTTGIRVRHLSSVPSKLPSYSDYRILLDEVPVMEGRVRLDRKFCPNTPEEIESAGIAIDKQERAENPHTGAMGYWLDEDSARQAIEHKLEIWDEPLSYVVQHLEAVLRRNLANFLGIQEVETILEEHAKTSEGEQQIASALPDRQTRVHFARLLRTLVKENTPITNIGEILQTFRELQLNSGNLDEAVRQFRLRNKSILPGNRPKVQRFELSPGWEEMVNGWVRMVDGKTKFTPPPDKAHELIQEIGQLVTSPNQNSVLVVRNHQTRPFLRRLLENRFPGLMVMSDEELVDVAVPENESKH